MCLVLGGKENFVNNEGLYKDYTTWRTGNSWLMVDKRQAGKKDETMQFETRKRGKKKDDRMPALKKDDTKMAGKKDERFEEFWKIFSVGRRMDVKLSSPANFDPERRSAFIYCLFLFIVGTFWLIAVSDIDFLSPSSPRTLAAPLPSFRFGATFLYGFKLPFIGLWIFSEKLSCNDGTNSDKQEPQTGCFF